MEVANRINISCSYDDKFIINDNTYKDRFDISDSPLRAFMQKHTLMETVEELHQVIATAIPDTNFSYFDQQVMAISHRKCREKLFHMMVNAYVEQHPELDILTIDAHPQTLRHNPITADSMYIEVDTAIILDTDIAVELIAVIGIVAIVAAVAIITNDDSSPMTRLGFSRASQSGDLSPELAGLLRKVITVDTLRSVSELASSVCLTKANLYREQHR